MTLRRVGLALLAPTAAFVLSLAVAAVALAATGHPPLAAFGEMLAFGTRLDSLISVANRAVPLYLAGLAVAVGFQMGLFNIGVEGQYRLAALLSAAAGAAIVLPPVLHVAVIVLVAVAVGATWAGIAGLLKVTRGVSEVISTIMLNYVATGLAAWLLAERLRETGAAGDLVPKTPEIAPSGLVPTLDPLLGAVGLQVPQGSNLQGFLVIAVLAGVAYWLLVWRTRFGFDLRASGINSAAAQASGVDARAMVVRTMLLSGALAGLVGVSQVVGFFGRYTLDFPTGLGFNGIAVALLGRNHPVGIAIGALLFGFLDRSAQILDLTGVPKEVVVILQGTIILSVVVAYEVVRRLVEAQEVRRAAEATGGAATGSAPLEAPA